MGTAPTQAEQTAVQASAAVFDVAFATTVPPPIIAANRALLMSLIATNFPGQNTTAIARTEAHYAEMWPRMLPRCSATPGIGDRLPGDAVHRRRPRMARPPRSPMPLARRLAPILNRY